MGQINGANAFQCFSKDGKFNSKTQEFRHAYMYIYTYILILTCIQSDPMFPSHQQVFRYFQLCRFVNLRENVNSTVQMLFSLISLQSFNLRTRSSGRTKSTVRFLNPHSNGTTIFTRVI